MSEYNLGFSKYLVHSARLAGRNPADGVDPFFAEQTMTYLSLLSCEITLKAMLEKAEVKVPRIHNLDQLLDMLSSTCEVEVDINDGHLKRCPAVRMRAITIKSDGAESTVGKILEGWKVLENGTREASNYPVEIRYGDRFKNVSVDALIQTAEAVISFAEENWDTIRQKPECRK